LFGRPKAAQHTQNNYFCHFSSTFKELIISNFFLAVSDILSACAVILSTRTRLTHKFYIMWKAMKNSTRGTILKTKLNIVD
ncbi:MAG: hypothetical protein O7D30_04205, partial [Rickettsia endosymbiont of Ixodes persulcatus]|nr:hypothetical protein [Rickettsia endosymbiont of Ixodes persulcatus]